MSAMTLFALVSQSRGCLMPNSSEISLLLVEDNLSLRNELADYLRDDGFQVATASDGVEMNFALEQKIPSIVILDLNLPGEDGISIARRLRSALPNIGVIILSARVRSSDRNDGYSVGADVYLTKPTLPEELVQVIKNLHRRLTPAIEEANWILDTENSFLLQPNGEKFSLTGLETLLIKELVLHGKFISHDDLIYYLGNPDESEEFNKSRMEVLISRLRKKFTSAHGANPFIKVIRGKGYQILLPITLKNLAPSGKSKY